ncbi:CBS domain-containing protein, partial [Microbaculum marinisediminis]
VRVDATVADAAQLMLDHRISGLPVIDEQGSLVGMITERDLLRRVEVETNRERPHWLELLLGAGELAEEYVRTHTKRIEDVMTRDVVTVSSDTLLSEVVSLMERRDIKRIPVVRDGKVIGIVSRANILRALARRIDDKPPTAGDDLTVRRSVLEELEKHGWIPGGGLEIVARDGVVELRGTVGDERVRQAIRVAAESLPGVKQVEDRLHVAGTPPGWI